jgi:hypothetical protein
MHQMHCLTFSYKQLLRVSFFMENTVSVCQQQNMSVYYQTKIAGVYVSIKTPFILCNQKKFYEM